MSEREPDKLQRFSQHKAAMLAALFFVVFTPAAWGVMWIVTVVVMTAVDTIGTKSMLERSLILMGTTAVGAVLLGLYFARVMFVRLRWHQSRPDSNNAPRITVGDWVMAGISFVLVLAALSLFFVPLLRLKGAAPSSTAGKVALGILLMTVSTANTLLFLRRQVRKRLAFERRRQISEGERCSCGYDLTGNVSGVCSECGHPVRRRLGTADSVDAKRAES